MNTHRLSLQGKHIVLGITGGIAAYKSVILLRQLIKAGAEVQVVMTPSAKEFVTPVTFASLSGKPVVSEFFTANTGEWHSHVDLGIWADLMVVSPATASTIAKMANGVADNMLVTTYLSAKEDVMIAPAMDLDMWSHPSTQRNIKTLQSDGVFIVSPGTGSLASGLEGKGRMAEPEVIIKEIEEYFNKKKDLTGLKAIVTAGPTYENIDPVRFIGNYSSGKMGYAIAKELHDRGAEVKLISGPVNIDIQQTETLKKIEVTSANQMYEATKALYEECDIVVFAAAVADYAPASFTPKKIKRENEEELVIKLKRNPDIAASLGKLKTSQINVGFALETDNAIDNAKKKLKTKNLDLIVLNSLEDPEAGFMKDTNKVTIITGNGDIKGYMPKSKREVAKDIVNAIVKYKEGID